MEEADSSLILKSLLSGGLAGMAGKSFVAPLDRVKILLQTHNEGFKQKGVLSSLGWCFRISLKKGIVKFLVNFFLCSSLKNNILHDLQDILVRV